MKKSDDSRNILLIIDMQNDFCKPDGRLAVPGAMEDVKRIARFVETNRDILDQIILTQDSHPIHFIAHRYFWKDQNGEHPAPFTLITPEDVDAGKWMSADPEHQSWCEHYVHALSRQGEYPHVIWPEHCIQGSAGKAIVDELMVKIEDYAKTGKPVELISKGDSPFVEHFGALRANIEMPEDEKTGLNSRLVERLASAETIYLAGQARSHCVANTLKQLLEIEGLVHKIVILDDCMSDVAGFENFGAPIYQKAVGLGARIVKSTEL